ncbi:MAG: hypothetical protein ACI82A_000376 [Candidatus Azotimanducaceae bacterium]|jgi:hypothetical protein
MRSDSQVILSGVSSEVSGEEACEGGEMVQSWNCCLTTLLALTLTEIGIVTDTSPSATLTFGISKMIIKLAVAANIFITGLKNE